MSDGDLEHPTRGEQPSEKADVSTRSERPELAKSPSGAKPETSERESTKVNSESGSHQSERPDLGTGREAQAPNAPWGEREGGLGGKDVGAARSDWREETKDAAAGKSGESSPGDKAAKSDKEHQYVDREGAVHTVTETENGKVDSWKENRNGTEHTVQKFYDLEGRLTGGSDSWREKGADGKVHHITDRSDARGDVVSREDTSLGKDGHSHTWTDHFDKVGITRSSDVWDEKRGGELHHLRNDYNEAREKVGSGDRWRDRDKQGNTHDHWKYRDGHGAVSSSDSWTDRKGMYHELSEIVRPARK
ncbi:hypothetical protein ACFU6K_09400 [Kitasatospora sp. NPDC057512]|uniref:hypothetical protein n=1 Tax=Kitasatospora sp. NPDC057512 TaxID=3346154 RepID=UPI00368CBBF7